VTEVGQIDPNLSSTAGAFATFRRSGASRLRSFVHTGVLLPKDPTAPQQDLGLVLGARKTQAC
jgi:hypothetical protein